MRLLEELYRAYRLMRKEGQDRLYKVSQKTQPEENQIRMIMIDPPAWCLVVGKAGFL